MTTTHPLNRFLEDFTPQAARKFRQLGKANWLLETTGAPDAADLKAELEAEYRLLYHDPKQYQQLLAWEQDGSIEDPLLKRQLNVLIRTFKQNQIPKELVEKITGCEAALAQSFGNFRPHFESKEISDNEILKILKEENQPLRRKKVWECSKEIGVVLAPQILALVELRNKAANSLGYPDYFQMQLALQEVDGKWLSDTLTNLMHASDGAYTAVLNSIETDLAERFGVSVEELGPWAWSEPFAQNDPLDSIALDQLASDLDIVAVSQKYYAKMGIDVAETLAKSDMYERPGKNQHAFCTSIDRQSDVRTLNNVRPTLKWLETVLHELGHAVYDLGYDDSLPWLLREYPHTITTEAMALLAGRQAYFVNSLSKLLDDVKGKEALMRKAEESLKRRQLIFSRWVLVMTEFEQGLYKNPRQDLNKLWWELVLKYQKIRPPKGRENQCDWAAKYHIGLAPVYYFSYLLGEMFASSIEETLLKETGSSALTSPAAGHFLKEKLFKPGNSMSWLKLVQHVTGKPLSADAWTTQFGQNWA